MNFNPRHELVDLLDVKEICVGTAKFVFAFVHIQRADVGSDKDDFVFEKTFCHTISLNDLVVADLGQCQRRAIVVDPGFLHFLEYGR